MNSKARERPLAALRCPVGHTKPGPEEDLKITAVRDLATEAVQPWQLYGEAEDLIREFYVDEKRLGELAPRLRDVRGPLDCAKDGPFRDYLLGDELAYGCKVAWRNAARCIGRLSWQALRVLDRRDLSDEDSVFEALVEHLKIATNDGRILPLISVFAPFRDPDSMIRIWNHQLIGYAGYRSRDGRILGDPINERLTHKALELGWNPGERTPFDPLPLLIQIGRTPPRLYQIPREYVLEVRLVHPNFPWFEKLGLKWYALPVISDMILDLGGVRFSCAPFNGWYMSTEIGARDLGDELRYNCLPRIAERMGLDTSRERSLWKDRALVELNYAVLWSFDKAGVRIVDHHRASKEFLEFCEREHGRGREASADWGWIVPPISGSATDVFHHEYRCLVRKPNFFYQARVPELEESRGPEAGPRPRHRATRSVLLAFRVISARAARSAREQRLAHEPVLQGETKGKP